MPLVLASRLFLAAALLAALILLVVSPARAEGFVGDLVSGLRGAVTPILAELLATVAILLLTSVLALARRALATFEAATGVRIEASHREAFQTAAANAAGLLASGKLTRQGAIDYVRARATQAIEAFATLDDAKIATTIDAKLPIVARASPAFDWGLPASPTHQS